MSPVRSVHSALVAWLRRVAAAGAGVVLVACDTEAVPEGGGTGASELVELAPVERAVRVSMALRGVRPSFEELDLVRGAPAILPWLVDAWLEDPRFGATVRDMANEALRMRADLQTLDATGALASYTLAEINFELQEAPLRLIERIVLDDLPYSDIVTADHAVANELVSQAWTGLEPFDFEGEPTQELRWVDGRPAAGILADSSLWVRWRSAGANAQRGRANLVSRALLCEDFLARDATIDTSAVADASGGTSLESPDCAGCHKSLDPLASFFPFVEYPMAATFVFPIDMYDATYESREGWKDTTGVPPNYFGLGGHDYASFVQMIATDPRFDRCAANRFWAFLNQRELTEVPAPTLDRLQALVDQTGSAKTVIRDIVLDPAFAQIDPSEPRLHRLRAEALPRMFDDLTGFSWTISGEGVCCSTESAELGEVHLGEDAYRGWVTLWGGIDGPYHANPTHASTTTSALILEEYPQLAAQRLVDADFALGEPAARRLLRWVEPDTRDEDAVREQLARLRLRLFGEDVTARDTSAEWTLFSAALADSGDPQRAWVVVLAAMLSDDRMEYY